MQDATPESTGLDIEVLYLGSTGSKVEELQRKLQELDFYSKEIDGLFGQGVQLAVKEFQARNGLAADGIAGISTLAALGLITIPSEPESTESAETESTKS
jgi:N-acetylmuramoyl-L-alanine amidase